MAATSPQAQSGPNYNYTRPSAAATRGLVDSHPPSEHVSGSATPSDPTSPHGALHRRKTNNYESALASRLQETIAAETGAASPEESAQTKIQQQAKSSTAASSASEPVVASGLAYRGAEAAALQPASGHAPTGPVTDDTVRPNLGILGRQQSWKQGDQKRAHMERMLSSEDVNKRTGYSTSQAATPV